VSRIFPLLSVEAFLFADRTITVSFYIQTTKEPTGNDTKYSASTRLGEETSREEGRFERF